MMYEIVEVVQLTYAIHARTEVEAIKMWQDLVGQDRPSRQLRSMTCSRFEHPSSSPHKSGRPNLKVVRPITEGEDDGPVPSSS
jgi:hypothetical protein